MDKHFKPTGGKHMGMFKPSGRSGGSFHPGKGHSSGERSKSLGTSGYHGEMSDKPPVSGKNLYESVVHSKHVPKTKHTIHHMGHGEPDADD